MGARQQVVVLPSPGFSSCLQAPVLFPLDDGLSTVSQAKALLQLLYVLSQQQGNYYKLLLCTSCHERQKEALHPTWKMRCYTVRGRQEGIGNPFYHPPLICTAYQSYQGESQATFPLEQVLFRWLLPFSHTSEQYVIIISSYLSALLQYDHGN